jgi:hypothetical protein
MKTYAITPIGPVLLNGNAETYTNAFPPHHVEMLAAWMARHGMHTSAIDRSEVRQMLEEPTGSDFAKLHNALPWAAVAPEQYGFPQRTVARFVNAVDARDFVNDRNAGWAKRVLGGFVTVDVNDGVHIWITQVQPMEDGLEGLYIVVSQGGATDLYPFTWEAADSRPFRIPDQLLAAEIRTLLQGLGMAPTTPD